MEQTITKAEFKRILKPGMKLNLTDCLLGPVAPEKQAREVVKPTSYGFIMMRPDGRTSDLRFEAGERITRLDSTLTIYSTSGEIAARYVIQEC